MMQEPEETTVDTRAVEVEYRSLAEVATEEAQEMTVAGPADLEHAAGLLQVVAGNLRELEQQRQFFVRPLNEQVSRINALFRTLAAPFNATRTNIEQKVLAYRKAVEAAAAAERARVAAEAEKARAADLKRIQAAQARADKKAEKQGLVAPQLVVPPPPPAPVVPEQPKTVAGMTARKRWRWELVSLADVPRAYLVLDAATIEAAVRGGARDIPGLRIWQDETLVVRGQ